MIHNCIITYRDTAGREEVARFCDPYLVKDGDDVVWNTVTGAANKPTYGGTPIVGILRVLNHEEIRNRRGKT